jgi:hypothetical protein
VIVSPTGRMANGSNVPAIGGSLDVSSGRRHVGKMEWRGQILNPLVPTADGVREQQNRRVELAGLQDREGLNLAAALPSSASSRPGPA